MPPKSPGVPNLSAPTSFVGGVQGALFGERAWSKGVTQHKPPQLKKKKIDFLPWYLMGMYQGKGKKGRWGA